MEVTSKLWLGTAVLFVAVMVSGPLASAQQQQKPNIVFMLTDIPSI